MADIYEKTYYITFISRKVYKIKIMFYLSNVRSKFADTDHTETVNGLKVLVFVYTIILNCILLQYFTR